MASRNLFPCRKKKLKKRINKTHFRFLDMSPSWEAAALRGRKQKRMREIRNRQEFMLEREKTSSDVWRVPLLNDTKSVGGLKSSRLYREPVSLHYQYFSEREREREREREKDRGRDLLQRRRGRRRDWVNGDQLGEAVKGVLWAKSL